jgi:hemolysin activation/secretion protein
MIRINCTDEVYFYYQKSVFHSLVDMDIMVVVLSMVHSVLFGPSDPKGIRKMKKAFPRIQRVVNAILIGSLIGISQTSMGAGAVGITPNALPGSVLPERASSNLQTTPAVNPRPLAPITRRNPKTSSLGAAADKIKFKLNKVILQDNHVYSTTELESLYKNKIGTLISVAQLEGIVQDITNYYRNNGYILTRAVLPPQHVANGMVYIKIVEGYVDKVAVIGDPKGAKKLVASYGEKITLSRPVQLKTMEYYLLLANEIPGVQVKAVLAPSKTNIGASNLDLVTETRSFTGFGQYDDFGTRFIGPTEVSGGSEIDSIFITGDSTSVNFARTTRGQQLNFFQLTYNMPLGLGGTRLILSANRALTQPGENLEILKIMGEADTVSAMIQYPVMRSRTQNMTYDASINYIDSYVTTLQPSVPLYTDHLRTLRTGINYNLADSYHGNNSVAFHLETGLPGIGGTPESVGNRVPPETSRFTASNHFLKFDSQLSRLQQFGATRYSAFFQLQGQYALEPLLATEQFGFGGVQSGLGRGYDPAEIIGDRGFAASAELRMNVVPQKYLLQAAQLYVFYDAGLINNLRTIADQDTKQSATSTGFGSRFYFTKNFTGNFLFAQPLTKQVAALELIGDGRQPRVFFSVTATD